MSTSDQRGFELRAARRRLERLSQKIGVAPPANSSEMTLAAIERDEKLSPFGKQELIMAMDMKQYRAHMHALQDMKNDGRSGPSQLARVNQDMRKLQKRIEDTQKKLAQKQTTDDERTRYQEIARRWQDTNKAARRLRTDSGADDFSVDVPGGGGPSASTPLISDIANFTDGGATQDRDPEFQAFFTQVHERNAEIDQILDRLGAGMTHLQDNARRLAGELKVQDVLLNDATAKAEKLTVKLTGLNKQVKEIINQIGKDQMCLYLMCCLLLLALVGVILYQTGILKK